MRDNSEQEVAELQDVKRHLLDRLREEVGDPSVVQAMSAVPREAFVPEAYAHMAYDDIPLPIGEDQTVSQPYMVALMIRAIEPRRSDKVLEIGTGSGYQAAVLSHLVERVVSVERIRVLADAARRRLAGMEYANVDVIDAGPQLGWPEEAPYDAIIVAAGAPKLPESARLRAMSADISIAIPTNPLAITVALPPWSLPGVSASVTVSRAPGWFDRPAVRPGNSLASSPEAW